MSLFFLDRRPDWWLARSHQGSHQGLKEAHEKEKELLLVKYRTIRHLRVYGTVSSQNPDLTTRLSPQNPSGHSQWHYFDISIKGIVSVFFYKELLRQKRTLYKVDFQRSFFC
jgi:hypothetical protein